MKLLWIEEYYQCGCSSEASRKKDLLGYCAKHGTSRSGIYRIPKKGGGAAMRKLEEIEGLVMTQEEWLDKAINRGTSGDMVIDILKDWERERNHLLSLYKRYREGIEKHKRIIQALQGLKVPYLEDSDKELYKLLEEPEGGKEKG